MTPQTASGREHVVAWWDVADMTEATATIEHEAQALVLDALEAAVRALPGEYPREDNGHPMGLGGLGEECMRRAVLEAIQQQRSKP